MHAEATIKKKLLKQKKLKFFCSKIEGCDLFTTLYFCVKNIFDIKAKSRTAKKGSFGSLNAEIYKSVRGAPVELREKSSTGIVIFCTG